MKLILSFVFLLGIKIANAQTCTGSLGDPIVNVTFGSGSGYGPSLSAGTTSSLNYAAENCPADGFYAITNFTSGCWANDVTWHTTTDHTGDAKGYFMLINASYQPSIFYIQTISGLCEGTTYQFAAWMLNMCGVSGILPNITLTIEKTDGSILGTYSTGDIPIINPVTWKKYGFNFTTPPNVSTVVLRMRNNAPGGVGNDVGLDDITFRPIGPAVTISSPLFPGDSVNICTNDQEDITLQSSVEACYIATSYQWQISINNGVSWTDIPGAVNKTFTRSPTIAGTYMYRLSVAQQNNIGITTCRVSSLPLVINVFKNDVRSISIATSDSVVCEGNNVTFTATTTSGGTNPHYQWHLNGNPVGPDASMYSPGTLVSGDMVNCIFTSSLPCNTPVISNSIFIKVNSKITTSVNISICDGESYSGHTTPGTYTDVFKSGNGCDSTRNLTLNVYQKLFTVTDTMICYGASFNGLTAAGTYNFTFSSVNGCDSVHTITLHVIPDINSQPVTDTLLCTGDTIVLSPGIFDTYLWQDGSTRDNFTVHSGGAYTVTVTNLCGTATKKFFIDERICNIQFPSAFTPNNDGINDIFKILNAYHLTSYHLTIFNRWGQKVFESGNPLIGWNGLFNGQKAGIGTYIFICEYTRPGNAAVTHLRGKVTLLR